MANRPAISRDTFSQIKRYFGGAQLPGAPYFDWDVNEKHEHTRFWFLYLAKYLAETGRIVLNADNKGLEMEESASPSNNVRISAGGAIVNGRLIFIDSDLEYTDEVTNYIAVGELTTVTEIIPTLRYKFTDTEKFWNANYSLAGCRIKFESGALNGSYFTILSLSGQNVIVSGDISTAAPGDSYRILPPAITTPTANTTDTFSLVTWWEDISPAEDEDLQDPNYLQQPSHRNQLRFTIHKGWTGTSGTDPMSGHIALELGTITRDAGDADVNTADITNTDNYIFSLKEIGAELTDLDSRIDTLDARVTTLDSDITARLLKTNVINKLEFSYGSGEGINFSYSSGDPDQISYSAGKLYSKHKAADTVEPHIYSISDNTFENTFAEQSHYVVDTAATDDSFTLSQRSSTPDVDENELVIYSTYAESTFPYNIKRAYPMADRPLQRGFDWVYAINPSELVTINPGWSYRFGTLYQSPDRITLDPRDTASWFSGSVPLSNSWNYIYMQVTSGKRSLTAFLDSTSPAWNGEHKYAKAFVVGVFRFNTLGSIVQKYKNGHVYFNYDSLQLASFTGTAFINITYTDIPLLIIPGAHSVDVEATVVVAQSTDLTAATNTYDNYSSLDYIAEVRTLSHLGQSALMTMPMSQVMRLGYKHGHVNDQTDFYLKNIHFDPLNTPDTTFWRT